LSSGLGNQLFQLAQGMALAENRKARLSFDTAWYRFVSGVHPVKRHLRLPALGIPVAEAFKGPKRLAVGVLAAFFDKTRRGKSILSALGRMQVIQEGQPDLKHSARLPGINANRVYLNGYWQTNTPFMLVRNKLLPAVRPRSPLSTGAEALIAKAHSKNVAFIHVRRGDYLHFMGEEGALPASYFSRAIATIQETGKAIEHWLIFSEDDEWAKANLGFVPNAEIVNHQSTNRDIEDLMVMKSCSAGIIANSSYSWWGAALGDHPDRPIIAPDRYWRNADWTTKGWALPNWTAIQGWS
jgi:Glycosyl transferase family 11